MNRQVARGIGVSAAALFAVTAFGSPASAAPADKPQVFSSWTQTSVASYNAFIAARNNQGAWASYGFSWSTDLCSSSPDNPLGFTFELPCARHDFGYRNSKAMGVFDAGKARIDSAFYEDLKRVCAPQSTVKKAACNSLAWTYYEAVKNLG
ncbi:phospholipase [Streptomyces beijiangensis]|uniref:Phospholipase n=1 Tax=Streptomyces beijiangensis TaxID=163361 RepID=A0A939JHZ5_9ACTN|nr:phospholipase [Streptomyces beijiangensis]